MEGLSPQFAHVIERCLESEPENRWQSASDVKGELEWAGKTQVTTQTTDSRKGLPRWIWGIAVSVLGLGLVAASAWFLKPKPEQSLLQVEITPPEGAKFVPTIGPFALSPDGRRIAFLATGKDGKRMLWLRFIDSSAAVAVAGTENADAPFWSPDSRWVGFSASSKLQKVDVVAGGSPGTNPVPAPALPPRSASDSGSSCGSPTARYSHAPGSAPATAASSGPSPR
jgi:hypothetical protein